MKEPVIIKSNKYGIQLVLDEEMPFEQLVPEVQKKFRQCEKFFRGAVVAVTFSGRKLSQEEQCQMIQTITDTIDITISCIIDTDEATEAEYKKALERAGTLKEEPPDSGVPAGGEADAGGFYRGTLRSGQTVQADHSVVIIGNVHAGAKVVSGGNIVVLGALRGTAYAGIYGDEQAFVAALEMDPIQIRIGSYIARCSDDQAKNSRRSKKKAIAPEPQVALVLNGNICIESITKAF